MKQLIVSVFTIMTLSLGYTKDGGLEEQSIAGISSINTNNCVTVRITQQTLGCDLWGIDVGGRVYPAFNLPESYKKEGTTACVVYELVEDKRNCPAPCCGGIWANIISIQ